MSKAKDIWNTKENADAYDEYALNFSMYKDTSRDLVEIAGIKREMLIVDLAAGTGATTQAIFDKVGNDVGVIDIDQAEEMLKKAREKFVGKNVQFIVSEAEDLDRVITKPVDAVICNSAFWQMKAKEVFRSVSSILKPEGVFAFNLPDSFFDEQRSVLDFELWGKEASLILLDKSVKSYDKSVDEILAFNEIPVMQRNFKTEDEKNAFITQLKDGLNKQTTKKRQWVYLVFKKMGLKPKL